MVTQFEVRVDGDSKPTQEVHALLQYLTRTKSLAGYIPQASRNDSIVTVADGVDPAGQAFLDGLVQGILHCRAHSGVQLNHLTTKAREQDMTSTILGEYISGYLQGAPYRCARGKVVRYTPPPVEGQGS